MASWQELTREYEAKRFPPARRLDVHAEGPEVARRRTLQWIQSFAHEAPGSELLLIVERGRGAGRSSVPSPVRKAVEEVLAQLEGGLIRWWQQFSPGSLALQISLEPRLFPDAPVEERDPRDEGRTPETAGAVTISVIDDIPEELLPAARMAAEMRRNREGLSVGLLEVLLRRIWIEAQAVAMGERVDFADALERIVERERALAYEDD